MGSFCLCTQVSAPRPIRVQHLVMLQKARLPIEGFNQSEHDCKINMLGIAMNRLNVLFQLSIHRWFISTSITHKNYFFCLTLFSEKWPKNQNIMKYFFLILKLMFLLFYWHITLGCRLLFPHYLKKNVCHRGTNSG